MCGLPELSDLALRSSATRSRRLNCGRGTLRDRGNFFRDNAHFLTVQPENHFHGGLQQAGDGESDIIQRILPKYIQLERERPHIVKATELQQLADAVFGEVVKMIDIVRKVLGAD